MSVVWVHHDAIGRVHPVFKRAGDARSVFVFDGDDYRRRGYSLKRLVFILECVEDAGHEVLEGAVAPTLLSLSPSRIFVARTPDPAYREVMQVLRKSVDVEVVNPTPFARLSGEPDLKRFFRYWNKAKRSAMNPDA